MNFMMLMMIRKATRFQLYSFLMIILCLIFSLYYYWDNGLMSRLSAKVDNKADISNQISQIDIAVTLKHEMKHLNNEIVLNKISEFLNLLKQVPFIERDQKTREVTNKLTEISNFVISNQENGTATDLILKINNNYNTFYQFVQNENYRGLSRLTEHSLAILKVKQKSLELYSLRKISKELDSKLQDKVNLVKRSTLSRENKNNVLLKLDQIKLNLKSLDKKLDQVSLIDQKINDFALAYQIWWPNFSSNLVLDQLKQTDITKNFFLIQISLIGLTFIFLLFNIVYTRNIAQKSQHSLEAVFVDMLDKVAINKEVKDELSFSDAFNYSLQEKAKYIQMRMKLGHLLQQTMPFSSVLLDNNLMITWANEQFYSQLGLSENDHAAKNLSWDYIKKLTDLEDFDPILDALKNDLSGIYQIKWRSINAVTAKNYEMYVATSEHNSQRYINLYFYSLENHKAEIDLMQSELENDSSFKTTLLQQLEACELNLKTVEDERNAIKKNLDNVFELAKKSALNFLNIKEKALAQSELDALLQSSLVDVSQKYPQILDEHARLTTKLNQVNEIMMKLKNDLDKDEVLKNPALLLGKFKMILSDMKLEKIDMINYEPDSSLDLDHILQQKNNIEEQLIHQLQLAYTGLQNIKKMAHSYQASLSTQSTTNTTEMFTQ
jgi:hypothetical protein